MINISTNRYTVSRAILGVIGIAGIVSVAILAPNALQMFRLFGVKSKNGKNKQKDAARIPYNICATIQRLQKEKCIIVEEREDDTYAYLTQKGKNRLLQYEQGRYVSRASTWDGKWRVVIFDVAEERRRMRNRLRQALKNNDFLRLQQSVWVTPYDCEDFINLLKTDQKLWGDVLYVLAESIEGDEYLRKKFKL